MAGLLAYLGGTGTTAAGTTAAGTSAGIGSTVGATGIAGQTLAVPSYGAGAAAAGGGGAGFGATLGGLAKSAGEFVKDVGQQRLSAATGGLVPAPDIELAGNPLVKAFQKRILERAGGGGGPTGGASGGPDRGTPVQGATGDDGIGALLRQIQEAIGQGQ